MLHAHLAKAAQPLLASLAAICGSCIAQGGQGAAAALGPRVAIDNSTASPDLTRPYLTSPTSPRGAKVVKSTSQWQSNVDCGAV